MEETKESDEDESYCVLAALLPAKARAIKNEVVQQAYAGEAHERSWHMLGGKQRSVGNTDRKIFGNGCEARSCGGGAPRARTSGSQQPSETMAEGIRG
ncbi:hypothetical protein PR003_g20654 [Phytophthora rubi]|uniref:Uncharacterized protein n=1 Tax=Phytophthora rubi TaxID=129364 RepID=A0A6A4DWJ4_9STRA|nr:hypothetical protein PR003_g20654 [Phytophthora rubi]